MNARTDKAARSGAIDSGSADTGSISSGSINSGPINSEAATTRLSRLLTMVPWLMNRQGIDIEEAARTLGVSRAQIEADPSHPDSIRTVRGVGYMYVPP